MKQIICDFCEKECEATPQYHMPTFHETYIIDHMENKIFDKPEFTEIKACQFDICKKCEEKIANLLVEMCNDGRKESSL